MWVTSGSSDDEFTHVYELDGSFDDAKGGPPLVANDGAFGPDGFVFEPGDGLTADIDLGDTYTIEFRVRVEASGHALKLFDFTDRATDGGLYVFDESDLLFWFSEGCDGRVDEVQGCPAGYARHPMAAGRDQLAPGSWATVRFARDGDTNTLSAEIDGIVQTWAVAYPPFAPQADAAVQQVDHADDFLSEATQVDDAPLHVLFDDRTTNSETGSGELDYLKIAIP